MTSLRKKHPGWCSHSESPVAELAILLQYRGFITEVLKPGLVRHGKEAYLLRYWREGGETTYLLMGDLGITWEPACASTTTELGRIKLEEGPEKSATRLAQAAKPAGKSRKPRPRSRSGPQR